MGIGISIFLVAAGALMTWGIDVDSSEGFNLNNAGVILMIIGLIGLAVAAFVWGPRSRRTVVEGSSGRRVTQVTREEF